MTENLRGSCDTCGQTFRLLRTGNVPTHSDPFDKKRQCKGSNLPPEPVLGDDPYGNVEECCAWCGEMRAPHQFEDGLRCVLCVEADEAKTA